MQDVEKKAKAQKLLNDLKSDAYKNMGLDKSVLDGFFGEVKGDIEGNPVIPEGFKVDINHLRSECQIQLHNRRELEKIETLCNPETTDIDIINCLANDGWVFRRLAQDFLTLSPAQAAEAKKLLDKASGLASAGKQAESLRMLSKALTIVIDHTPPARKMHAFQAVSNLRGRLS